MLFHAFWVIYTIKELDFHAKVSKNDLDVWQFFCAKYTPSGFV